VGGQEGGGLPQADGEGYGVSKTKTPGQAATWPGAREATPVDLSPMEIAMRSIQTITNSVKADWPPRDAVLDENISPELWGKWADDFVFTPVDVLGEQEAEALAIVAEMELIAEELDDFEHEDQVYLKEFHKWLDSLVPSIEECERRDSFLGHL
jgi:hypothetical protein